MNDSQTLDQILAPIGDSRYGFLRGGAKADQPRKSVADHAREAARNVARRTEIRLMLKIAQLSLLLPSCNDEMAALHARRKGIS
jgi:hypothetical protein